ncbi:MAG: hypothetical protein KBD05_01905 [Candidatus Pacebacteria bacterium]|nr:hypothetical protein [Candidatus Paceibacterota bacterium]
MPAGELGDPRPQRSSAEIKKELQVFKLMDLDPARTLRLIIEYIDSYGAFVPVDLHEDIKTFSDHVLMAYAQVVNKLSAYSGSPTPTKEMLLQMLNDMQMLGNHLALLSQNTDVRQIRMALVRMRESFEHHRP